MIETFRVKTSLDEFERIVLLYKAQDGKTFIGHSFYYGGRDGSEYLLFLYNIVHQNLQVAFPLVLIHNSFPLSHCNAS